MAVVGTAASMAVKLMTLRLLLQQATAAGCAALVVLGRLPTAQLQMKAMPPARHQWHQRMMASSTGLPAEGQQGRPLPCRLFSLQHSRSCLAAKPPGAEAVVAAVLAAAVLAAA
jgi:hypothetical protein